MKVTPLRLGLAAALVLIGGLVVAWSGLFNVAASGGHWRPTAWFLHYVMQQSVATHSAGIEAPPLDDTAMVQRGAGHFATACAPCHGAPGEPQSPVVLSMTPPPPSLIEKVPTWEDAELFWILQEGIIYSGMPAWPTQARPDEVWSVVAFLRRLPTLDADGYERLARGEVRDAPGAVNTGPALTAGQGDAADPMLAPCARCHGRDGAGGAPGAFPRLTGQSEAYLAAALRAYKSGQRASGIMQHAAVGLSEPQIAALARHYAGATAPPVVPAADPALVARGREIAERGVPAAGVPACASCHAPAAVTRNSAYPSLAGQDARYLEQQLALWQEGVRGGSPYAPIMTAVGRRLSDEDRRAVTAWYASLPPEQQVAGTR